MKKELYTYKNLSDYLTHFYMSSYCTHNSQAFYNPRKRTYILVSIEKESFSREDVIDIFKHERADLSPDIEWCRFKLFLNEQ